MINYQLIMFERFKIRSNNSQIIEILIFQIKAIIVGINLEILVFSE